MLLNLGQGVAWDNWVGRGVRRNHPEDYHEYVKGCDIASFDIYPVVHDRPEVAGKLWFVAQGVERLVRWAGPERSVWNCIECTRIGQPERKATPHQVRAEVWMSLIHGSQGIIYFVHELEPVFVEARLLQDPQMLAAVTAIDQQIRELAPALNSPNTERAQVASSAAEVPVDLMAKEYGGDLYIFAAAMRPGSTRGTFQISNIKGEKSAEVLGEERRLEVKDGSFADEFGDYGVHLYRIEGAGR